MLSSDIIQPIQIRREHSSSVSKVRSSKRCHHGCRDRVISLFFFCVQTSQTKFFCDYEKDCLSCHTVSIFNTMKNIRVAENVWFFGGGFVFFVGFYGFVLFFVLLFVGG